MSLATAEHIAVTQRFIDENPNDFTLERPTLTDDGAGGVRKTGTTTLEPQTMRLVGSYLQSAQTSQVTVNGQVVVPEFTLIALPSADVQVRDTFTFEGKVHEVVFVSTHPEWRKAAAVYRHA